jgi:ADP-heptose:LPS heptosyltransferase
MDKKLHGSMKKKNLILIHQGALGDFIAIFPAIHRLSDRYDRVDVICQSQLGKLGQHLGLISRWFPLESASFSSLFAGQPDPEISARLSDYDQVLVFSASAELEQSLHRIMPDRCTRLAPKPPADQQIHVTAWALQNLTRSGLIPPGDPDLDDFYGSQDGKNYSQTRRYRDKILLHPGSGSKRKRWPLSQFKQTASLLNDRGFVTEFILGPAEQDLREALEGQGRKIHALCDLVALTQIYQTAGGYIGNDSGASHLAAFVGLPTLVIFGPADPARWKPNGPYVEVVRPELSCQACFETETSNCQEQKCLEEIKPATVIEAFCRVYQRYG